MDLLVEFVLLLAFAFGVMAVLMGVYPIYLIIREWIKLHSQPNQKLEDVLNKSRNSY